VGYGLAHFRHRWITRSQHVSASSPLGSSRCFKLKQRRATQRHLARLSRRVRRQDAMATPHRSAALFSGRAKHSTRGSTPLFYVYYTTYASPSGNVFVRPTVAGLRPSGDQSRRRLPLAPVRKGKLRSRSGLNPFSSPGCACAPRSTSRCSRRPRGRASGWRRRRRRATSPPTWR